MLYVERNHAITLQAMPNDPRFVAADSGVWGLNMVPLFSDADIDGPEAWDITTGSRNVVVATIDSGIDYTHEDLAANMWRNEADCNGNGVDDDGNGFVDDCYGIAPINGNSDPMDDNAHGTHVAGTIGAVGNNGVGVVGVNWNVRLMPCKMFDADGNGSLAAAIACLDYVAMMKDRGVNVVATNNSWSDNEYSAALRDAIDAHRQRGILFVAAAGNYYQCADNPYECRTDTDNDRKPTWPANYQLPNIISVANSVDYGFLNAASGRGRRTVHLAAPGTFILSTTPANTYDYFTGTSMATPHVTGVAALLKAQDPTRDWRAIRNLILAGTDGDLYPDDDDLITLKRLNARGALACANSTVTSRLRPIRASVTAVVGRPMELSVLNIRCAVPNGDVTVTVSPGGQTVTLRDDGAGIDQAAGDGTYSGQWTPAAEGTFSLTFPGADVVTVQVLPSVYTVAAVPFGDRAITGTPLQILPGEPAEIVSPFPLRFAGGSFTSLFVDERGAAHFDGGGFQTRPHALQRAAALAVPLDADRPVLGPDPSAHGRSGRGRVGGDGDGAQPRARGGVAKPGALRRLLRAVRRLRELPGRVLRRQQRHPVQLPGHDVRRRLPGPRRRRDGDRRRPGVPGRRDHVQLPHRRARRWHLAAVDARPGAAAGDRRDAGLPGLRHRHGRCVGGHDLRGPERRHGDADGRGQDRGAVQHRVRWHVLAGRGADADRHGALQPDVGRHVRRRRHVHRWRQSFPIRARSRRRRERRARSAVGARPVQDGRTTALAVGAWTNQTSIVLKFTMVDASPVDTLTPEVEIKPLGTAFTGAGLRSGAAVASTGAPVQGVVSVTGLTNGSQYHWRARTRDAAGQTSGWVSFGGNAETARDVGVDTSAPSGSIVVASGSPWTKDAHRDT